MNMMKVTEGHRFITLPFQEQVSYAREGDAIAPNANKVMRVLTAYAQHLGMATLSEMFTDAFSANKGAHTLMPIMLFGTMGFISHFATVALVKL